MCLCCKQCCFDRHKGADFISSTSNCLKVHFLWILWKLVLIYSLVTLAMILNLEHARKCKQCRCVWTLSMCRDKPHVDGKSKIHQPFTRHKRFYRQESIDADNQAWKEVAGFYKESQKVELQEFFLYHVWSCRLRMTVWLPVSDTTNMTFMSHLLAVSACMLSTFNTLHHLEISVTKTLIIHEISPPLNLSSSAVGIFNNTNQDFPPAATVFRGGTSGRVTESSFQLAVILE